MNKNDKCSIVLSADAVEIFNFDIDSKVIGSFSETYECKNSLCYTITKHQDSYYSKVA